MHVTRDVPQLVTQLVAVSANVSFMGAVARGGAMPVTGGSSKGVGALGATGICSTALTGIGIASVISEQRPIHARHSVSPETDSHSL